jgi:hypothetical protein
MRNALEPFCMGWANWGLKSYRIFRVQADAPLLDVSRAEPTHANDYCRSSGAMLQSFRSLFQTAYGRLIRINDSALWRFWHKALP